MPSGPRGRGGHWHHTPCPPGDLNYLYVGAHDAHTVTSDCEYPFSASWSHHLSEYKGLTWIIPVLDSPP